jgi:hypothetical protein
MKLVVLPDFYLNKYVKFVPDRKLRVYREAYELKMLSEVKINICFENHKDKYIVQENLRKAAVFVRRVCLSARNLAPAGRIFIKFNV